MSILWPYLTGEPNEGFLVHTKVPKRGSLQGDTAVCASTNGASASGHGEPPATSRKHGLSDELNEVFIKALLGSGVPSAYPILLWETIKKETDRLPVLLPATLSPGRLAGYALAAIASLFLSHGDSDTELQSLSSTCQLCCLSCPTGH